MPKKFGECCCDPEPFCTGISVKAESVWNGFGAIPDKYTGYVSGETEDVPSTLTITPASTLDDLGEISEIIGAIWGSIILARFGNYGDRSNGCTRRFLTKNCGWEASTVYDEAEGLTAWSQEWDMELEQRSGALIYGLGVNTGSTAFWASVAGGGHEGPDNIGEFWHYDLDEADGDVTTDGSPFNGFSPGLDLPIALIHDGALSNLLAADPSAWPVGAYITFTRVSDTEATVEASTTITVGSTDFTLTSNVWVELSDEWSRAAAVADAEDLLSEIGLDLGVNYTVYESGTPVVRAMDWMNQGRDEGGPTTYPFCLTDWTNQYVTWPVEKRIVANFASDESTNCCKTTVSAKRHVDDDGIDVLGFFESRILVEKGRVPPNTNNCVTHHEEEYSETLPAGVFSCNYCTFADPACPPGSTVTSGFLTLGVEYEIEIPAGGASTFVDVGAADNNVGTVFTCDDDATMVDWDGGRLRYTALPNDAAITCEYPYDSGRIEMDGMAYYWGQSDLRQLCTLQVLMFNPDFDCEGTSLCYAERPIYYAPYDEGVSNCCSAPPFKVDTQGEEANYGPSQTGVNFTEPAAWKEIQFWKCEPRDVGGIGDVSHCERDSEPFYEDYVYAATADAPFDIEATIYDFNGDLATVAMSRFLSSPAGTETVVLASTAITGCTVNTACELTLTTILGSTLTDSPPAGDWYYRLRVTDDAGNIVDSWRRALAV